MASTKPYLIRAIYEWCADEGLTPYVAVQVDASTRVPIEYVRDGQIVLNISSGATQQMLMGNDEITFQARFGGTAFPVVVPVDAVLAIYAKENGQGMAFDAVPPAERLPDIKSDASDGAVILPPESGADGPLSAKRGGHLTRVK